MIDPKRSKFKKQTHEYKKDGVFDIIDIQACLEKNKMVPKVKQEEFIYGVDNQLKSSNLDRVSLDNLDKSITRINKNRFGFKLEELDIEYKNGYIVKLIEKYIPIDIIGEGAFSTVISAYDDSRKTNIAIKIIVKKINHIENLEMFLENETKIQLKLDHPNIVKLYEVIDNTDYLYMFMEIMTGGTLKDLIIQRYLSPNDYLFQDHECALIIKGVIEALNYIHSKNIMHRDIKPENILFKDFDDLTSLKIGDFGLATFNFEKESKKCGTLLYMAPEIVNKKSYDSTIDIWATGFVLYILCSGGKHPLYTRDMYTDAYIKQITCDSCWEFPEHFALLARNLFFKMCKFNTTYRYEALKVLRHPWVSRSSTSSIPETLIECYCKMNKLLEFKNLLSIGAVFHIYKARHQNLFSKLKEAKIEVETKISTPREVENNKKTGFSKCNSIINRHNNLKCIISPVGRLNASDKKLENQLINKFNPGIIFTTKLAQNISEPNSAKAPMKYKYKKITDNHISKYSSENSIESGFDLTTNKFKIIHNKQMSVGKHFERKDKDKDKDKDKQVGIIPTIKSKSNRGSFLDALQHKSNLSLKFDMRNFAKKKE